MSRQGRTGRELRAGLAWGFAGVLLALPFQADALEPLGLLAPVPWLLLAASSPTLPFRHAWAAGLAFVVTGLWWLNAVHPVATLTCGLYFGAYAAAGAWACARLVAARWPLVVAAPLCVLAYETLVQRFALFPSTWLAFGALSWRVPSLAQVASIGGVSLLSAAIVAVPAGICDAWLARRRGGRGALRRPAAFVPAAVGLLVLPALALLGSALVPRIEPVPLLTVALVQGNVPQSIRNRPAEADGIVLQHAELTVRNVPAGVGLVAWPESTASLPLEQDADALEFLGRLSQRVGAPLLLGAIGVNGQEAPSNSAFLLDGRAAVAGRCDKRCLVPGAETLLVLDGIAAIREPVGDFLSRTMHFRPFLTAGREPVVLTASGVPFGALICYDDVVPGPAEELRAAGARALVTITNEAWFGRGELRQHLALAVFRCIETRLPMARCGNDGLTCLIDPAGRVTSALPPRTEGVLVGELASTRSRPVAPIVRAAVGWSAVAAVVAALALPRLRRRTAA